MSYIDEVKSGVLNWLETVRVDDGWGKWKLNAMQNPRPYDMMCSVDAISILKILGELDSVEQYKKDQAISFFQSCQDSSDGYFKDPTITPADYLGTHKEEDIWAHNAVVEQALRSLGAVPLYKLPQKSFVDLDEIEPCEWILSQDWTNPWLSGERFHRVVSSYIRKKGGVVDPYNDVKLNRLFEAYEHYVHDPATGMPIKGGCKDPSYAMAGLFKAVRANFESGRRVLDMERAVDYVLALQHSDGEFGMRENMCINWDSLWILIEFDKRLGKEKYRHNDIYKAIDLTAEMLLNDYRKDDGGFAFHKKTCATLVHSVRASESYPISDTIGTSMCLTCLQYADEWKKQSAVIS